MARRQGRTAGGQKVQRIYHEIVELVDERGSATKEDITDLWDLDDVTYPPVARKLRKRRGLRPQASSGGFRLRQRRTRETSINDHEDDGAVPDSIQGWEREAIIRLMTLFKKPELEKLVGLSVRTALDYSRRTTSGKELHLRKFELARALLIEHNSFDLFRAQKVREAVAQKCGMKNSLYFP